MVLLNLSGGVDEDMGNWKYLDENIEEDQTFSEKSNDFESIGTKISVTLPEDKRLRLIRAVLEPISYENTSNHCYADILFGGLDIGSIYYGNDRVSDTEERREVMLHGDGIRKLEVNVTGIAGQFSVRMEGYYIDSTTHTPHKPLRISAAAISPDEIRITSDLPEDNGGLQQLKQEFWKTKTPDNESTWALDHTITEIPENGSDISYVSGNLDDNAEYFYKCRGINSKGAGEFSSVVSARTEIDHPAKITSLVATPINSTQVKLNWTNPTDTGGVPQKGTRIEMSTLPDSGFSTVISNTGNLNTEQIITGLDTNTPYYFRAFAINTSDKESLIPSNVTSATPVYDAPTNLTVTVQNKNTIARLNWTAPVDTNGKPVQKSKIFRKLAGSGAFALLAEITGDGTTYDDDTIQGNKVYEYYVVSIIDGEETPQSGTSSVTIPIRKPTAPTNLTAVTKSDNKIDLTWDDPTDDGGSPLIGYDMIYSENSDFSDPNTIQLGLVNSYSLTELDHDTIHYFKVQAKNALHIGAESTISNSTTFKTLFEESENDLTVPEGESVTIGSQEYHTITNNGTLIVTAGIIRAENYAEGNNGKIIAEKTGCSGGSGGITAGGTGGAGGRGGGTTRPFGRSRGGVKFERIPPSGGKGGSITLPGIAVSCTDLNTMPGIVDGSIDVDTFESQFINNVKGGRGSDGTAAATSGNGGSGGEGCFYQVGSSGVPKYGGSGGKGGTAAQGVAGVRGGGKIVLYIRNILSKIIFFTSIFLYFILLFRM